MPKLLRESNTMTDKKTEALEALDKVRAPATAQAQREGVIWTL